MFSSSIRQCRNALFLSMPLLGGCFTAPPFNPVCTEVLITPAPTAPVSALRQSRYTLIELRPELQQQDLQQQIIDLRIPASASTTVGDAMRYVLRYSGYRLCEGDPALATLWALPLPAAHLQLGPLPLNQTLQLLAGSAWRLSVNERARQVCFIDGEVQP
ncbi:MAG TPA: integrating conjugative element protein pill, pfgi-1 [Pseudomonas sp.]|nr:integrating conjugative element protein pill, pfgi-1 [Pseudomonas sp.]